MVVVQMTQLLPVLQTMASIVAEKLGKLPILLLLLPVLLSDSRKPRTETLEIKVRLLCADQCTRGNRRRCGICRTGPR
jgi:hypothetical protein